MKNPDYLKVPTSGDYDHIFVPWEQRGDVGDYIGEQDEEPIYQWYTSKIPEDSPYIQEIIPLYKGEPLYWVDYSNGSALVDSKEKAKNYLLIQDSLSGSGWEKLYQHLIPACISNGGAVQQVKEKFGSLRFYYTEGPGNVEFWKAFRNLVTQAELLAYNTCISCGGHKERSELTQVPVNNVCGGCRAKGV